MGPASQLQCDPASMIVCLNAVRAIVTSRSADPSFKSSLECTPGALSTDRPHSCFVNRVLRNEESRYRPLLMASSVEYFALIPSASAASPSGKTRTNKAELSPLVCASEAAKLAAIVVTPDPPLALKTK